MYALSRTSIPVHGMPGFYTRKGIPLCLLLPSGVQKISSSVNIFLAQGVSRIEQVKRAVLTHTCEGLGLLTYIHLHLGTAAGDGSCQAGTVLTSSTSSSQCVRILFHLNGSRKCGICICNQDKIDVCRVCFNYYRSIYKE